MAERDVSRIALFRPQSLRTGELAWHGRPALTLGLPAAFTSISSVALAAAAVALITLGGYSRRVYYRWWLPTISLSLWLVFFLSVSLSDWRLVLISADGDPCLHRRIGNWMIEHRAVIHRDQFSHTRFEAPLISKEWLSEIAFAAWEPPGASIT